MPYRIEYGPETEKHFEQLTAHDCARVLDKVTLQLLYQPTVETLSRKRMRPNPLAPWELRIGELRVYFSVEEEPERVREDPSRRHQEARQSALHRRGGGSDR